MDSLDESIQLMGRHQRGREIPPGDRKNTEAFLKSLLEKS